jgi:hypothetical protein
MSDAQTIVDCDAKLNWRGASPQDNTIRAGPTDDAASRPECGGVFRIAIVQKIATVSKRARTPTWSHSAPFAAPIARSGDR